MSRDLDARLGDRDQAAVQEWLQSNKAFHITRDHPEHGGPILGGAWGCKLTDLMRHQWKNTWKKAFKDKSVMFNGKKYGQDQKWLWG